MMKYVLILVLGGVVALGGLLYKETKVSERLQSENEALKGQIEALETKEKLAKNAQKVLARELTRRSEKAAEYDRLKIALERGGEDETLPDWFTRYVNCLLPSGGGNDPTDCP